MAEVSKLIKRTGGGKFAPGFSGNPAGKPPGKPMLIREMTRAFAAKHGEDLLELLRGHAYNRPEIALALSDRVFGLSDWTGHGISSLLGELETVEDCEDARDRVLTAYTRGVIDLSQCEKLETLIAAKKAKFISQGAGVVEVEAHGD